jgi:hypothetical protein
VFTTVSGSHTTHHLRCRGVGCLSISENGVLWGAQSAHWQTSGFLGVPSWTDQVPNAGTSCEKGLALPQFCKVSAAGGLQPPCSLCSFWFTLSLSGASELFCGWHWESGFYRQLPFPLISHHGGQEIWELCFCLNRLRVLRHLKYRWIWWVLSPFSLLIQGCYLGSLVTHPLVSSFPVSPFDISFLHLILSIVHTHLSGDSGQIRSQCIYSTLVSLPWNPHIIFYPFSMSLHFGYDFIVSALKKRGLFPFFEVKAGPVVCFGQLKCNRIDLMLVLNGGLRCLLWSQCSLRTLSGQHEPGAVAQATHP